MNVGSHRTSTNFATQSYLQELKRRAHIAEVWVALGGGPLRHGRREQAFWRRGDGRNVAIYSQTDRWWDYVTDDGGDAIDLVRRVHRCGFRAAVAWLADFTGVRLTNSNPRADVAIDRDWATDLVWATWWRTALVVGAELALEELSLPELPLEELALAARALEWLPPLDPVRFRLTLLLASVRVGDAALVDEYRWWRRRDPEGTAAMAHAGRLHHARIQRDWAPWIWVLASA
jgi:hypothetical protein